MSTEDTNSSIASDDSDPYSNLDEHNESKKKQYKQKAIQSDKLSKESSSSKDDIAKKIELEKESLEVNDQKTFEVQNSSNEKIEKGVKCLNLKTKNQNLISESTNFESLKEGTQLELNHEQYSSKISKNSIKIEQNYGDKRASNSVIINIGEEKAFNGSLDGKDRVSIETQNISDSLIKKINTPSSKIFKNLPSYADMAATNNGGYSQPGKIIPFNEVHLHVYVPPLFEINEENFSFGIITSSNWKEFHLLEKTKIANGYLVTGKYKIPKFERNLVLEYKYVLKSNNDEELLIEFVHNSWENRKMSTYGNDIYQKYDGLMLPPDKGNENSSTWHKAKTFFYSVLKGKFYDKNLLTTYKSQSIEVMLHEIDDTPSKFDNVKTVIRYLEEVTRGLLSYFKDSVLNETYGILFSKLKKNNQKKLSFLFSLAILTVQYQKYNYYGYYSDTFSKIKDHHDSILEAFNYYDEEIFDHISNIDSFDMSYSINILQKFMDEAKDSPKVLYLLEFLLKNRPGLLDDNSFYMNFNSKKYLEFLAKIDKPSSNLQFYCLKCLIRSHQLSESEISNFFPLEIILRFFIELSPRYSIYFIPYNQHDKVKIHIYNDTLNL